MLALISDAMKVVTFPTALVRCSWPCLRNEHEPGLQRELESGPTDFFTIFVPASAGAGESSDPLRPWHVPRTSVTSLKVEMH